MTVLLIVITFGALAVAGALLFSLLRLSRHERDRSEARAEALRELIDDVPPSPPRGFGAADTKPAIESAVPQRAPMFGHQPAEVEGPRSRLLMVPAIGVAVVGLALTGIYVWNRPASATAATVMAVPLELVSLRHETQGETLIVSGLVRNPSSGGSVKGLTAVAFSFDRQGTFLASGRAPIDYQQLGAGEESPFSVSVPQSSGVARFRVSFRTDAGIVPHLDRRAPSASASSTQVTK